MIRKTFFGALGALAIAFSLMPGVAAPGPTAASHAVVGVGQTIECYLADCSLAEELSLEATDADGGSGQATITHGTRTGWSGAALVLTLTSVVIDAPVGSPSDYHEVHAKGVDPLGAAYCLELRVSNSPLERDSYGYGQTQEDCNRLKQTDAATGFTVFETDSTPNSSPVARFSRTCDLNVCRFDATSSTDLDGSIARYDWSFGDGTVATGQVVTHEFPEITYSRTYEVILRVTDNRGATNTISEWISVYQRPPTASFDFACSGLTCGFTDTSTDAAGGTITAWSWDFDDDGPEVPDSGLLVTNPPRGGNPNPSHTYPSPGTYTVTLTVADNDGATATTSRDVTVTDSTPPPVRIELAAYGYKTKNRNYVDLQWSGSAAAEIEVFRDWYLIATTPNDGVHTDVLQRTTGTFTYHVCEKGTSNCSNRSTVTVG